MLTNQLENLATESLFYLLKRYKSLAKDFNNVISDMGLINENPLNFDTQIVMSGGEIPDLVGTNEEGDTVLLVESKFWAPLTPNQPISYLSRLSHKCDGMVLILGPASRYNTLWPKLLSLCEDTGINPTDEIGSPPNPLSVRLTQKSRLGYLSWGYLLNHFQTILENDGNTKGSNEVWQLIALSERLDSEAFHPLGSDDLISSSDRFRAHLKSIINILVENVDEAGFIDLEGYRATPGPGYYRRYFTFLGRNDWYLEYNENKSQRLGISLLIFGGPNTDELMTFSRIHDNITTPAMVDDGNQILFPLELPAGVERDDIIRNLFDQVVRIARLIKQDF